MSFGQEEEEVTLHMLQIAGMESTRKTSGQAADPFMATHSEALNMRLQPEKSGANLQ